MEDKNVKKELKIFRLLSVDITTGKRDELFSAVAALHGRGGAVFTPNPEILSIAQTNTQLKFALSQGLNIPDGVGVKRALSRRGIFTDTYPGVELGEALLTLDGVRLGIYGGRAGVADMAMRNLLVKHPGVISAFTLDGYSNTEDDVCRAIENTEPTVVFVCLGSPKQEVFISRIRDRFASVLFLALGGSADVYAGYVKRAPRLFRRAGLEWLFRMLASPARISRLPRIFRFLLYDFKSRRNERANISKKIKNRPLFLKKSYKFDKN